MSYTKIYQAADNEALREEFNEVTEAAKILAAIEAMEVVENED